MLVLPSVFNNPKPVFHIHISPVDGNSGLGINIISIFRTSDFKTDLMKKFYLISVILFVAVACYSQDGWNGKSNFLGGPRVHAVAFSIGTKGYITTGFNLEANRYSDLWQYDQTLDAWSQKADFVGGPRESAVGFSIGTKGYVGTGFDDNYNNFNDFWEYNPATNVWTSKANYGGAPVSSAIGFSIGSKGYIGTGYDANARNDFWEYDPVGDTWTRKADFGGGVRDNAIGFCIGAKGYIGLGINNNGNSKSDFWEWNQATNIWTRKADFPDPGLYSFSVFSIASRGYVYVGDLQHSIDLFLGYNPCVDQWNVSSTTLGTIRVGSIGFSIGNYGYIGSGSRSYAIGDTSYSHSFYEYIPSPLLSSITTNAIPGSPFCGGTNFSVGFYATGGGNICNIFTAQLSNAAGSFNNPVNIGTLTSDAWGTNFINAMIPFNTPAGTGYRIRIVSSDPVITGSNNGANLTINPAPLLNLKFFTQGYYINGGILKKVLHNEAVDTNSLSTNVDTVVVELHNGSSPYAVVESYRGVLQTNGTLVCYFSCNVTGHSYYIAVKHRNTIQTWSTAPVAFTATTSYDFTTAANKAYGNNMKQVQAGVWAFYTGDINQDENVDLQDFPTMDYGIAHGQFGYYASDLNGDGNVDLQDFPFLDANIILGIFSQHP